MHYKISFSLFIPLKNFFHYQSLRLFSKFAILAIAQVLYQLHTYETFGCLYLNKNTSLLYKTFIFLINQLRYMKLVVIFAMWNLCCFISLLLLCEICGCFYYIRFLLLLLIVFIIWNLWLLLLHEIFVASIGYLYYIRHLSPKLVVFATQDLQLPLLYESFVV